jgi:hypothetical protein
VPAPALVAAFIVVSVRLGPRMRRRGRRVRGGKGRCARRLPPG